jgi:molecular chaperone GrpE (heat shock protein)
MGISLNLIIVLLGILGLVLMGVRLFMLSQEQRDSLVLQRKQQTNVSRTTSHPIENKHWLKLVEECVELYDQLDRNKSRFDRAGQELTNHVSFQLQEILERCGVETIAGETTFDYTRHQAERTPTSIAIGASITETLSPGFSVGRRVLRRARVLLDETPRTGPTR